MTSNESLRPSTVEESSSIAKEVYVVMQNNYRISRNIRAQWFFRNLNKTLKFKWKTSEEKSTEEIEVISAIPRNEETYEIDKNDGYMIVKITPETEIKFLSTKYRFAFCLDLSASVSTVDIQHDSIFFEEGFLALKQSLTYISQPFYIPGSKYYFAPQIYVTVIAYIPSCSVTLPQVLIQGWILTKENLNNLLDILHKKLILMCNLVVKASVALQEEELKFMMPQDANGSIIDGAIDSNKMIKKILDLSADVSSIKLIQYGILSLQLLPENSSAGIIVVTDGVLNFPNCRSLDSLLSQLRNSTIACSFLQLGSPFHPFSCFGRIPYIELMEFIATATCGAYFPSTKDYEVKLTDSSEMNSYQRALLFWSFQKTTTSSFVEAFAPSKVNKKFWHVENPHFYTVHHQSRVRKKHTEGTLKVSLENLLSCRLREGYSVKSVSIDEGKNTAEVKLTLPWMLSTSIEYIITCSPGRKNNSDMLNCHFEVIVDGCYEFLHDVTCSDKQPIKSIYRKTVITQFWNYIKNLSNTDHILTQLHSFAHNPVYYTIPESIKNGVPLFYFPTNSSLPVLSSKNLAKEFMQFTQYWKTLCMLDINIWQKWMHAHRIGIILQHDPLPKNLHLPNASGRYTHIQCRQANTALNSLLSEDSSFVLVENHSYIKLLFDDPDKPPTSFYVIRVTSKPPCVVIRLAFLGGLPGNQRFEIVNKLREKIMNLKLSKRTSTKDYSPQFLKGSSSSELPCCVFLKKPVEKILIRYEKLPSNFLISVSESLNFTKGVSYNQKQIDSCIYTDALITLSKYLLHQRWIWTLQYEMNASLDLNSASKILYAITSARLQEGFHFTHSGLGIIYMVQEMPIEVPYDNSLNTDSSIKKEENSCTIQYIIFPPHTNTTVKDSISEEDDTELTEADGELQLITECWIEPQCGITKFSSHPSYLNKLKFEEIPEAIHCRDIDIVTVLTTFEHLCNLCKKTTNKSDTIEASAENNNSFHINVQSVTKSEKPSDSNMSGTHVVPYAFSIISLLPKCPQTEITFSSLHTSQNALIEEVNDPNCVFYEFLLGNIRKVHDREILLNAEDSLALLFQVHHRERNEILNPPVPFRHPDFCFSTVKPKQGFIPDLTECEFCFCPIPDLTEPKSPTLTNQIYENIPQWKCYIKGTSSSHILITLMPHNFQSIKKLYQPLNAQNASLNLDQQDANEPSDAPEAEQGEADEPQQDAGTSHENSVCIPFYVYSCASISIINQLIYSDLEMNMSDNFEQCFFECECCIRKHSSISSEQSDTINKHVSESSDSNKRSIKAMEALVLKEHCILMEKSFSKAFAYGVYRSLVSGLNVNKHDAIAAIDEICEETLLEIDITEFVFMICGHVKDFIAKQCARQLRLSQESYEDKVVRECKMGEENEGVATEDIQNETERALENMLFPFSVLEKHQPCENLQQKHLSIKERFLSIIMSFFKTIPQRPDYYFFNPVEEESDENSLNDANESQDDIVFEKDASVDGETLGDGDTEKNTNLCEDELNSNQSFLHTESSVSSLEKDSEICSVKENENYPPLFVHFSCSVRIAKQEMKSYPLTALPTCLNEVIKCLDPERSEVNLDDMRITLDMFCLTVPDDIENPEATRHRVYSTSYSSNSPIPEAESYSKQPIQDDVESTCSDIQTDTILASTLASLPARQHEAVHKCVEKIKWLLQDEKASVALSSYPITSDIINMVINHVKSSKDKLCCLIKEVPLMFVYGPDSSLEKFTQAFKRISPSGFGLKELDGKFYLVLDSEFSRKVHNPFDSLVPPLVLIDTDQITKMKNPEADDPTQLQLIGEKIRDGPVFTDMDFSYFSQYKKIDDLMDDNNDSEGTKSDAIYKLIIDKRVKNFQKGEDSDTDDGQQVPEIKKYSRKSSGCGKSSSSMNAAKRTESTPTLRTERKLSIAKRPQTAPGRYFNSTEGEITNDEELVELSNKGEHRHSICVAEVLLSETIKTKLSSTPKAKNIGYSSPTTASESLGSVVTPDVKGGMGEKIFHSSNTEDGYDGDSSDNGSEWDRTSNVDYSTRPSVPPKFWIIMEIFRDKVMIYFHMREREEENDEVFEGKSVLNDVVTIVSNICKEVNQILLLQSLYDTKMCNQLLVPEENEDVWKNRDFTVDNNRTLTSDDPDILFDDQDKYLEAALKYEPGTFGCPVVWVTHFKLHPRLTSGPANSSKSWGMQALRTVLSTFAVNNRENMFVYQENLGTVFYLRLYEETCDEIHHSDVSKTEHNLSLTGSCSSLPCLIPKKTAECDPEDFRPRVNSGASDGYRQDSISTTSVSKKVQKCVTLRVHGIGEVGSTIKNDLVKVLQNRLDEGVLDIMNMMLSRNPLCMLSTEDVQFIQNPSSTPTYELYFTLPVKLLGHTHSIQIYLRQNLLHFLHNPKYHDSRKETHFKAYWHAAEEWGLVDDNDVFLYHSQQASGHAGGKGIACVVLSLVTGQGQPFNYVNNIPPNPMAYQDGLSETEFEDLTSTSSYILKQDKSPGPVALIRFQIWSMGRDCFDLMKERLKSAVQHSLWDLLMEYRALTAPISESAILEDSSCYSEPTTPIRARRTGVSGVNAETAQNKDSPVSSIKFHSSKEMSSSVPDMSSKTHSPPSLVKEITAFKFSNGPQSAKPEFHTKLPIQSSCPSPVSPTSNKSDKRNLNLMYYKPLNSFLQYGSHIGSPSLSKFEYELPSRHAVILILKEITNSIKLLLRDAFPRIYIQHTDGLNSVEFLPFCPEETITSNVCEEIEPGVERCFIVIGRNEKQWKAYMGHTDFSKFQETGNDSVKIHQKYQTHVCNSRGSIDLNIESVPSSPTFANKSASSGLSVSPQPKSPVATAADNTVHPVTAFVPRQKLFLMMVKDKSATLFLYNCSQDTSQKLLVQIKKLIAFHQNRNCLLSNIMLQKLGIFYGLSSFNRTDVEKPKKDDKNVARESIDESVVKSYAYVDQLVSNQIFTSSSRSSSLSTPRNAYIAKNLKNTKPTVPFHLSEFSKIRDPVSAHGGQFLDTIAAQRRGKYLHDMQVLHNLWSSRGSGHHSFDKVFSDLKCLARLSHYCLTPILFSPSWRSKVAPVRDHALEPLEQNLTGFEKPQEPHVVSTRSRHSSGSSLKSTDAPGSAGSQTRTRRFSGATYPSSNQGSPKLRTKTPSEETWHAMVCRHYLQEYVTYMHTMGFVSLQASNLSDQRHSVIAVDDDRIPRSDSFSRHRGPPVFYLIKCLLGGLLVFELGLSDPYAYGHLYSLECSRFKSCTPRVLNSQFTAAFLDELDKIKFNMHLHSFTYDYHLRTIHSYISGHQLIFRHGYHLTSFLDDFIKYYQKVPTGARNLVYSGTLTISDINRSGAQLYNYIISHNKLYGMTVLRMVPVSFDSSSIDTEFALVELLTQKASYKDANDVCQIGSFDVGLLINLNTSELVPDPSSLVLNFYIILTSQRDLYPKLSNLQAAFHGSFQTVRFGSALTSSGILSRKVSYASIANEKDKFDSSGEESICSTSSRSKKTSIRSMCDEDVMYLGYYSSQETMMQQVISQQAAATRDHLEAVVKRASVHCRRDHLWSFLLLRSLKEENNSKDHGVPTGSFSEFAELLGLVTIIPLNDYDEKLTPFMNMHISWYTTLAPVLMSKYADNHRQFLSSDGSSMYIIVTNTSCPDTFMLLTIDARLNRTELSLVLREPSTDLYVIEDKPNQRVTAIQSLIEGFVNVLSFHLWTCMLSAQ